MLLLALDTSTRQASIALCAEDALIAEYTWQIGNNHSVELLERVRRVCAESDTRLQSCDAIAVTTGPGSFNGLRVALATAKTLAFALRKPLIGIGTLDVFAAQQQHWQGPICPLLEAGRGEVYTACYSWQSEQTAAGAVTRRLQRLSDYLLLSPTELANFLHKRAGDWFGVPGERALPAFLFCGEMSDRTFNALQDALPTPGVFARGLQSLRHASILAMLAIQRLSDGGVDDPLQLEPFYLRRPSITSSTRKQPLLGQTDGHATAQPATLQTDSKQEREKGALRR